MSSDSSGATIGGIPTKYISLVVLVVQNSALVLTMRYSRILPGPQYLTSTAVVVSELLKCTICLLVHLHEQFTKKPSEQLPVLSDDAAFSSSSAGYGVRQLSSDLFSINSGFYKLLIPAFLYTFQNNLQFVAASNLDAATFQVTYQGKILTTALFSVIILRRDLSLQKWISLLVLTGGVACVQVPSANTAKTEGNAFLGLMAVAIACLCSGFAGVYFEWILKSVNSTSLAVRNVQLSVWCLGIALLGAFGWDGKAIVQGGFFQHYNPIVVLTICIQAAGGLIVAVVIKYADNILKGFATSISIILSTVASIFLFDFVVTIFFCIGTVLVILATYLYGKEDTPKTVHAHEPKGLESTPMLVVEDYDEKDDKDFEDRSRSRDQSDVESIGEQSRDHSPDGSAVEERTGRPTSSHSLLSESRKPSRNFSPSLLQTSEFGNGQEGHNELDYFS